jgi:hypothetical protein
MTREERRKIVQSKAKWLIGLLESAFPAGGWKFIEIGVWKGDIEDTLMMYAGDKFEILYAVDPFGHFKDGLTRKVRWQEVYERISAKFDGYGGKVKIIRAMSDLGTDLINDKVHLVFVDGDHTEAQCYRDILNYEPKVLPGGFMTGHDYEHPSCPGVRPAVDRYAREFKRNLVIPGIDFCWGWRLNA